MYSIIRVVWISFREVKRMYSKEYEAAKKEFVNCICMCVVGLGVPLVLAFREWWPIMKREKEKALQAQRAAGKN